MKIKKNITIELSENEVKEIVAEYLRTEGYEVTTEDVKISVKQKLVGPRMNERYEPCFEAIYAKCKEK